MRLLIGLTLRFSYQPSRSPRAPEPALDYRSDSLLVFHLNQLLLRTRRLSLQKSCMNSSPPKFSPKSHFASISRAQITCTSPSRAWSM